MNVTFRISCMVNSLDCVNDIDGKLLKLAANNGGFIYISFRIGNALYGLHESLRLP